jgi:hypothetical protein
VAGHAVLPERVVCQILAQVNVCQLSIRPTDDVVGQIIVPKMMVQENAKIKQFFCSYPSTRGTDSKTRLARSLASWGLLLKDALFASAEWKTKKITKTDFMFTFCALDRY